jgi:AraC-like DNA-binding protein
MAVRLTGSQSACKQLPLACGGLPWLHVPIKQGSKAIQHWAKSLVPQIGALEPDTVSANFVDRILRGAVNMGASRPRLLAAIHISDAPLRNPIGRVSRAVLVNLFAAIEREFGDPAMAMRMAANARPQCFSDLGHIALFSTNVGQILQTTVDIQGFRQNVWHTQLDSAANPAKLVWTVPDDAQGHLDAAIEFSAASYTHLYRNSLPTPIVPLQLSFSHRPRFGEARYAELVGCPVQFGAAETALFFDRNQLSLPSPKTNPVLQQKLLAVYQQPMDWLAKGNTHGAFAYLYLASELNKSPLKLERLAASFGMTERSLRRKLVEEGHPFRALLEKVRRDLCDLYRLEGSRSMSEVAELLGYAELSAFSRAHRNWYGVPPSENW